LIEQTKASAEGLWRVHEAFTGGWVKGKGNIVEVKKMKVGEGCQHGRVRGQKY